MLGYGYSHFLVAKKTENFDMNEWRLGTIDKSGNILNEMKALKSPCGYITLESFVTRAQEYPGNGLFLMNSRSN